FSMLRYLRLLTPFPYTTLFRSLLGSRYPKLSRILEGGSTRNETTLKVIEALGETECKVILHDAVRPLLDERIIADCVDALDSYRSEEHTSELQSRENLVCRLLL